MIILVGIQASGKTSFYKRHLPQYVHISLDELHSRRKEAQLMQECFQNGYSVVVDNTDPTEEDRARYIIPGKREGYHIIGYFLRSSLNECIARNKKREGKAKVPEIAIRNTYRRLELPSWEEGFDELYDVQMKGNGFEIREEGI